MRRPIPATDAANTKTISITKRKKKIALLQRQPCVLVCRQSLLIHKMQI